MVVSGLLPGKSTEQVGFFSSFFPETFLHSFPTFCENFECFGNSPASQAELATLLGCLEAAYTTLEMRETSKEKAAGDLK